jgi:hypothetical protein
VPDRRPFSILAVARERHGRSATAAQLGDLEVVPARSVSYRGASFAELDVRAVLDRRPELALVDELAHATLSVQVVNVGRPDKTSHEWPLPRQDARQYRRT